MQHNVSRAVTTGQHKLKNKIFKHLNLPKLNSNNNNRRRHRHRHRRRHSDAYDYDDDYF